MTVSVVNTTNGLSSKRDSRRLQTLLESFRADLAGRGGAQLFNTGALVIHGAASALAKTVNTVYFRIGTSVYSKAAADCAALAGTVTAAAFNVYVFYVDAAGTMTASMGTEGATLAAVVFPATPAAKATIGFVIINPTGTGNFVGGTTALDDATVVPGAIYVNTVGSFNTGSLNTVA